MNKTIVFLCSGGGGNLRFVHYCMKARWVERWSRMVIIADRECPAINYAREQGLEGLVIDFKVPEQKELIRHIFAYKPDLIITTIHRILSVSLVNEFKGRMLNLHYSILPAFAGTIGTVPVRDALEFGSRLVGATVHKVTEIVDKGQPQVQVALPVTHTDTLEQVMDSIFRAGCVGLFTALKNFENNSIHSSMGAHMYINNRPALISPSVEYPSSFFDDSFWNSIKS